MTKVSVQLSIYTLYMYYSRDHITLMCPIIPALTLISFELESCDH